MSVTYPTPTLDRATLNFDPVADTDAVRKGYVTAATGAYLPLAGGVVSGAVTHQGTSALNGATTVGTATTAANFNAIGPSGSSRIMQWMTGGSANANRRWQLLGTATAESSTATGSDLQILAFDNTGAQIGQPMTMTRSSGNITFNGNDAYAAPVYTFHGNVVIPALNGRQLSVMNGGTLTLPSGAWSTTQAPLYTAITWTSSGVVTPTVEPFLWGVNITDTLQLDDTVQANNSVLLYLNNQWGGPGTNPAAATTQGQRIGIDLTLSHVLPSNAASTAPPSALGARITVIASAATLGAGSLGEAHEGLNVVMNQKATSVAGSYSQTGVEVDMISEAGSVQPINRAGFVVSSANGDAQGGSRTDFAFGVVSANTGGMLMQYGFGKPGGAYPFKLATTLIGTMPYSGQDGLTSIASVPAAQITQPVVTNGLELSRVAFDGSGSGTGRAIAVPQFVVTDQGKVFHGSGMIQPTSTGITIDTPLAVLQSITSVVGGSTTGKVFNNDRAWDETCQVRGSYLLTVAAGVVTAVTVINPPSHSATPATLVLRSTAGGCTVNVTWTAGSAQAITLGGTGALKVGAAQMTANGAIATALSSVGPTGSHTTVQEWLTITNSSGTVRYIPCF
jgi:hypothetical protein